MRNRCFRVLRKVSPAHSILPKSYLLPEVTLSGDIPFAIGGRADIWKGEQDGKQVCVKAFRLHSGVNLDKLKRVCGSSLFQRGVSSARPQSDVLP